MLPYQVAMDYGGFQRQNSVGVGTTHQSPTSTLNINPAFTHSWFVPADLCVPYKQNQGPLLEPGLLEMRKEKSRDAARSRRGKENFEFYELAKMLPLPAAITSQLDKASIIRLTISYLKLREFSMHGEPPWNRDSPQPNKIVKSTKRARLTSTPFAEDMFEQHQGTHILQSLDGFAMAVAADGRFLYISETVSIYLGLSQVEMTGSSVFDYVHQQDHAEVAEQLGLGLTSTSCASVSHSSNSGLASPNSTASEEHNANSTANPDVSSVMALTSSGLYKGYDRAFCIRMKSTLTKRGCHFKSSGYRVVLLLCRLRPQYPFHPTRKSTPTLMGMVGLAIALPPPSVHEIRLEADMFVTRINFDFRIAHCEPKVSELLDYTADELTGKSMYGLCHGEDAHRLRKSHVDLINKGQVLTHYYRLMNKSGGYTWVQTCATVVCNSKNAEEQNVICVNYVISGREYENLIMDCCQLEENVPGVKRENASGHDPENGSPDADRGAGQSNGDSANQHLGNPDQSPSTERDDSQTSAGDSQDGHQNDKLSKLQQESQQTETRNTNLTLKMFTRSKRKFPHEDDTSSGEENDIDESGQLSRNHVSSPASSNNSLHASDQVLKPSSPNDHSLETSETPDVTPGTSVKDLEQAMSKHLPSASLNKPDSTAAHQPTDFSADTLLKQQQQKSTIQWIGAHHLGHLNPQQTNTPSLPASALLRQLYANRESVIRANVHGITSSSGRTSSSSVYYSGEVNQGPLPTPPSSEGSSAYGEHQFVLGHSQKPPSISETFNGLVSSYSIGGSYGVEFHSTMTPPSSVSPRDKQQPQQQSQQQQQKHKQEQHGQQQQKQPKDLIPPPQQQQPEQSQQQQEQQHHISSVISYETSVYNDTVPRHQYEPAQPLPLKPQVYAASIHPSALDAAAVYTSASLSEHAQFYHHPATGPGFHLYHSNNKNNSNSWYSSAT
ncbi:protein trachealess isoform X3 [Cotesia glomerata]|uniref:protein trachealess isoform X3 n=1 Tax=Cotesia glomerata TaxID=32391 RepID=UPI001D002286|nr:protein trachealess isoform X3 [Cotesia glomerata]